MGIVNKIIRTFTPHYVIIDHYTGEVIGCCRGKTGKKNVLSEEPLSTFTRLSKRKCPVCKELNRGRGKKI